MKLPLVDLAKYNAQAHGTPEGFSITSASGDVFGVMRLPPDPIAFEINNPVQVPTASWAAQHSINTLLKLDNDIVQLKRDQRLSDFGREERLEPLRTDSLRAVGGVWQRFSEHATAIDNLETQRYAVPQLDRTDVVGYLRDREIRDNVRAMGDSQRSLFEGATKDPELMLSILRSPMKFGALEKLADFGWRSFIDERDQTGLEKLKLEKASIDWARSVMGLVRVELAGKLGYERKQLFEKSSAHHAAPFFGFSAKDIVHYQRMKLAS